MSGDGMYCSTCGSYIPRGRGACDTCGAVVGVPIRAPVAATRWSYGAPATRGDTRISVCPRCTYRGEGVGYFSTGRHMAGLVAATMFTSWAMGAGGLAYYLLRREHRICPRCGVSWGQRGELAEANGVSTPEVSQPLATLGPAGRSYGGFAILLFLFATIMAVGAIVNGTPQAMLVAAAAGAGGVFLYRRAETQREARRAALISALQLPVLKLASERGGRLTVTQVATQLGWTLPRAEKVLESMDDGYRVSSEVTDEGMIVYEFRELIDPNQRLPGRSGS